MSAGMAAKRRAAGTGALSSRCSGPAGSAAIPGHLPPWPGAPSPSPAAGSAPLTGRVADNASVLETLSCEATEEIYYL